MKIQSALGLLLVVVSSTTGSSFEVDLNVQVEYYFKEKNIGVESWGLTKNYTYWADKKSTGDERPITAKLRGWKCLGGENASSRNFNSWVCRDKFTWNIARGIRGPFPLTVTLGVTVFDNGTQKPTTVDVDLTNKTTLVWEPQRSNWSLPTATVVQEKCSFSARAVFEGRFAYKVKERRGDMPDYYSVLVKNLENSTAGLEVRKNKLRYFINGTYEHVIICDPTPQTNKVKSQ
uniref:Secreted protein n=1 Tax=Amblyomma parvum TaxID=251391 RepID=A0A023FZA2_AMBPA